MKLTLPLLILIIGILSCNNSKPQKEISEKERIEESAKKELSDYSEKIVLLSTIQKIPYDSLNFILIDYYSITSKYTYSDSLQFYSKKAITDISQKYHIAPSRIATLIFSFKYEMLTKEEIFEKAKEDEYEQERDQEQESNYY